MIAHRFTKHRIDGLWLEGGHYEASGGGALVGWTAGQGPVLNPVRSDSQTAIQSSQKSLNPAKRLLLSFRLAGFRTQNHSIQPCGCYLVAVCLVLRLKIIKSSQAATRRLPPSLGSLLRERALCKPDENLRTGCLAFPLLRPSLAGFNDLPLGNKEISNHDSDSASY